MNDDVKIFDLLAYLQDSLSMIDDESKRSEIVDIITTIQQAQADNFFLLHITREAHNNVSFETKVTPIYTKKRLVYNTKYGGVYNWENWIICKPCHHSDSENNPIYVDNKGNHFIVSHISSSSYLTNSAIRNPIF